MRRPLVAGNWKMHGALSENQALIAAINAGMNTIRHAEVAVCPPHVYLMQVANLLKNTAIELGAQNLSDEDQGAYTGEVSGAMLTELGCQYVIIGHSERRTLYAEDDVLVARKFAAACRHGLKPILCIGETLAEREQGITEAVVARQLDAVISEVGVTLLTEGVIAYEPVWAIGTGRTASPEQAQAVHAFIRSRIEQLNADVAAAIRILYGGSVKADNAETLFAQTDIDGGLIGGASLKANDFMAICQAADRVID
ncbi:triose-phosphate isomerase [Thiorhodospira sibirica]|uniref:triose-phosphate isomerase n=1 Tax=Thiorhodospira sibirica TaxID=154347 RepID=UPI00022C17A5|nr:triose-phosphate isomerase [Thiorhodospira sibirica]